MPRKKRPEIALAVRDLLLEVGMKPTKKQKEAFKVIVANLYAAWATRGNPFLVVPKRSSDYASGSRQRALYLTYQPTMKAVEVLRGGGFIEYHAGFYTKPEGRRTRIRATSKLTSLFIKHRFNLTCVELLSFDLVQLRGPKVQGMRGAAIDIRRGVHAASARPHKASVAKINAGLASAHIDLHLDEETFIRHYISRQDGKKPLTPPHPLRNRLYRVFNENFNLGGRFYGHWAQGIPRDLRSCIRIDGEPVVELDYKAIHPTLLYAERGESFEGEVYLPASYTKEYRPVFKLLMLAAVNAVDLNSAFKGARHCIHKVLKHTFPECLKDTWLRPAYEALKTMHEPIGGMFFTRAGLRLQRKDSKIAELVMLTLLDKGVITVPIHDSFLVAQQHEDALREAMLTCSRAVCGLSIPVDKKHPKDMSQHEVLTDEVCKTAPVMEGGLSSLLLSLSPPSPVFTAFIGSRPPHPQPDRAAVA
ncbi:MAG: hypothetical protein HY916_11460 [Desulfovibrio sp.]|nr:hypothetical protein [Desulfovibrio sp.]